MIAQALLNLKSELEEAKIINIDDIPTIGFTKDIIIKLSSGPLSGLVYYSEADKCYAGLGFYWKEIENAKT